MQVLREKGPSYLDLGAGDKPPLIPTAKPKYWDEYVDGSGMVILSRGRTAIGVADLPYVQSSPIFRKVDNELINDRDPKHMLASLLSGYFSHVTLVRRAQVQAIGESTRAAAALLAYKSRNGSFPATLAEALSPVPTDPFTDNPLHYRREEKGFVVYSVGEDGKFAGGEPGRVNGRYDVAFRYPVPSYYARALKDQ